MRPDKKDEWQRIRVRGFTQYLLLHGIFPSGIISATVSILIRAIVFAPSPDSQQENWGLFGSWVFLIIFGSVVGIVIAAIKWIKNEISMSGALRTDHDREQ